MWFSAEVLSRQFCKKCLAASSSLKTAVQLIFLWRISMSQPNPGDPLPIPLTTAQHANFPVAVPNMFGPNPFAVASPTAAPTGGHRAMPTLLELFHSFKRRWILGLLIGAIVASVVAAAIWMVLPSGKHKVQAIIQVRANVFTGMVKESGPDKDTFDRIKDAHLQTIATKNFQARVANDKSVRDLPMILAAGDKASVYEKLLKAKFEKEEMLHLWMNGDEKDQLQKLLAAFVRIYVEDAVAEEKQAYVNQERVLNQELAKANTRIKEMDALRTQQKTRLGNSFDPVIQRPLLIQDIGNQGLAINKLESDIDLKNSQLELVIRDIAGELPLDPELVSGLIDLDSAVRSRLSLVEKCKTDLAEFQKTLQDNNPKLTEKRLELAKLKSALEDERTAVRPQILKLAQAERRVGLNADQIKFTNELISLKSQLNSIKNRKDKLEKELTALGPLAPENVLDSSELAPTIDMRNRYVVQLAEIQKVLTNNQPRVLIKEDAVINENYNRDQKIIMSTGAALVAMLGILLIISYLEWRNRRVDGVDQVVTELGMRVIGTIPAFPSRASLRSGEASQNQNWRFILNESVNSTRTMLLHAAKTQQMQIILVTSAMQGEGKTSLSSQLATSMATAGLRTLILDCDLRNPSMQKLFDIPVSPGCSEILLQEIDIADAVQPTSVPNLWIIPAGQCNHRVIAALAQGHPLEAMFNRLRGQFDIIIVDSCPILPVADTLLVAQHVDGVVFSILQDVSQLPKVHDASERMVHLNVPLLGAVVNGIKPDIQAYGYNYVKQLPA